MIGRVLTFVACVSLVSAVVEICEVATGQDHGAGNICCIPITDNAGFGAQLKNADTNSYPPPELDSNQSGFGGGGVAGFKFTVKVHRAFAEGPNVGAGATTAGQGKPGPALPTATLEGLGADVTYSGLPAIKIAKLDGSGYNTSAGQRVGTGDFPRVYTANNCMNEVSYKFQFTDVTGNPAYHQTTTSNEYKYVFAAMNIITAANVYGDKFQDLPVARIVVETMTYKFKFKTQVVATTTATVTYAAIDYNVVLTSSKIRAPTTDDWITQRKNKAAYSSGRHAACTPQEVTDAAAANSGNGAAEGDDGYCVINPEIRLDVGITTVVPKEYVTTLRTSSDATYAPLDVAIQANNPFPILDGFKIRSEDFYSGLDWVDHSTTSLRKNGINAQAATGGNPLDGTPGIFNSASLSGCYATGNGGHCKQEYLLFFKYEHVHNPGKTNYWANANAAYSTYTGVVNNESSRCQLKGAQIRVGNAAAVASSGDAELWCRNMIQIDVGYAGASLGVPVLDATHGTGSVASFQSTRTYQGASASFVTDDISCPFAADKSDNEDDIDATVTITTSNWCPVVAVDNDLETDMATSKTTFFSNESITLYARAKKKNSSGGLAPTQLKWKSVYGKCPASAFGECDILGDAVAPTSGNQGTASARKLFVKESSGTVAHNGQVSTDDDASTGDLYQDLNWSATTDPTSGVSNCETTGAAYLAGWDCSVQASFNLCEHIGSGGYSTECGASSDAKAFAIHDSASSTGIDFVAVLSVGFPNVDAARKRATTIQLSPSKEVVYSLLQTQSEETELEVTIGYGPRPVTEEAVEEPEAETTGANNPVVEEAAAVEESNSMLIYIIVGVFLFISVFVGALVMYLRRSKNEKKVHPVPITVEVNKSTAAMA